MQESLQRSQRQVQQVKLRLGLQVDDRQFQTMINESGVLLTRDHTKWNYEIIMDLLQGPLLNPKRLDEVIRVTKFIRRLFSFFHPLNNRFSSVLRTRVSLLEESTDRSRTTNGFAWVALSSTRC